MSLENIDPSLALGFFCSSKEDFESFCSNIQQMCEYEKQRNGHPLFFIADTSPQYEDSKESNSIMDGVVMVSL